MCAGSCPALDEAAGFDEDKAEELGILCAKKLQKRLGNVGGRGALYVVCA